MEKDFDLHQMAEHFRQSLTGETAVFENFLIDYTGHSPAEAFKNLALANPTLQTAQCAEDFNYHFISQMLHNIQEDIKGYQVDPASRQAKVLIDFFHDYMKDEDFNGALQRTQKRIDLDSELRKDLKFQSFMQNVAEKVRPAKKVSRLYSLHEDESTFFKIRPNGLRNLLKKLADHEVKEIMEDSLKKFYVSHHKGPHPTANIDVGPELESVFKRKELPLALQLAYDDTLERTEQTVSAIRSLDMNTRQVVELSNQGIKFKFTKKDFEQSVAAEKIVPANKTSTEKMDIVRDLIIGLKTSTVESAFENAIGKITALGDQRLLSVLQKHLPLMGKTQNLAAKTAMLSDAYQLYVEKTDPFQKGSIETEATYLAEGRKMRVITLALDELRKKEEALQAARGNDRVLQKAIHSYSQKDMAKFRTSSLVEEIQKIAKKTGVSIHIEEAESQLDPELENGNDIDMHLN